MDKLQNDSAVSKWLHFFYNEIFFKKYAYRRKRWRK